MPTEIPEQWVESWELSKTMFEEAGVDYVFCDYESD